MALAVTYGLYAKPYRTCSWAVCLFGTQIATDGKRVPFVLLEVTASTFSSCPIPALSKESSIVGAGKAGGRINMGKKHYSRLYSEMQTVETCCWVKRLAVSQISTYEDCWRNLYWILKGVSKESWFFLQDMINLLKKEGVWQIRVLQVNRAKCCFSAWS